MNTKVKSSCFMATWTSASWSDPVKLKEGFESIGMAGLEPLPLKPSPALKQALAEHFNGKKPLIRPLEDDRGFLVMNEKRGHENNDYTKICSVRGNADWTQLLFNPLVEGAQDIATIYDKRLRSVPGDNVGEALVKIVHNMNGTKLRKTGGFYSLSSRHEEKWLAIQKVIEGAATEGESKVYKISMEIDADSIRLVRDSIQDEIMQVSKNMLEEMLKGDIGERAMKNRLQYLDDLTNKVKEYEQIVGESLGHLAAALDNVKTASGLGAFQEMMRSQVA